MKRFLLRLTFGLAVLLPLGWLGLQRHYPSLPVPLALTLTLPAGQPGWTLPLIVTGDTGAGDLLYVRYADATTLIFGYDSWAVGGPASAPLAFTPGAPLPLRVEMPSLAAPRRAARDARGPLRVALAGREVLQEVVHYHGRQPDQVYFAANPIGGTITNHAFAGTLATADGLLLHGRPSVLFPWTRRMEAWLREHPLSALGVLAASLLAGGFGPALLRSGRTRVWRVRPAPEVAGRSRPTHAAFLLTAAACTGAFVAVITGFSFRLFTAESFGQFYDYQAASLLQGRLDVPEAALGSESFVFGGRHYGYFGPTPAVLRLPFALAGIGSGQLSRSFMVAYYVASLAVVYALLLHATRLLTRRPTWPARCGVVLLVGGAGLGSTLFFLGSRAYIYHEAILCGVAFALWGAWAVLRWLAAPAQHRWWVIALIGGVASVQARPPTGLFTLAFLGCTAAWRVVAAVMARAAQPGAAPRFPRPLLPLTVGALSVLGVLSFNGMSYLKFRTFEGAPLRYHVQYHPERIAVIEGRNFHVGNLPYGAANYLWAPNLSVRPTFPYFFIHGIDPRNFPGARIDLAENTLALPYGMPALVLLAGLAALLALLRWTAARPPLALLAAGTLPMALALFAAVAVSQRYTADFTPALLAAAAFGVAGLDTLPGGARRTLFVVASVLTVAAMLLTVAITLHYQGEAVWGVPADVKARYLVLRQTMDSLLGFSRP